MSVQSIQADATQQSIAYDEYVQPPKSGYQYMLAEVSATYLGNDPREMKASPAQIRFEYVTEGAIPFEKNALSANLGDKALSANDLYPDVTSSGLVIFCIPEDDKGDLSVDTGSVGKVIDFYQVQ